MVSATEWLVQVVGRLWRDPADAGQPVTQVTATPVVKRRKTAKRSRAAKPRLNSKRRAA